MLTIKQIKDSLLGDGATRIPTQDFWRLHHIWRKTLSNAGIIHSRHEGGWIVNIEHLTPESLAKACSKSAFRAETIKSVGEAVETLKAVFADEPAKLEILNLLTDEISN